MRLRIFIFGLVLSLFVSLQLHADSTDVPFVLRPIKTASKSIPSHPSFDIHYWCAQTSAVKLKPIYFPAKPKLYKDKTIAFYALYFLTLLLGIIRYTDPKYFRDLWGMFWGLAKVNRDSKEHLHGAAVSNLLMNIFFVCTLGVFLFFTIEHRVSASLSFPLGLLPLLLVVCVLIIYLVKFAAIQFFGWAFKLTHITEQYIFNVFLVNKILAVLLLPMIILLAFSDKSMYGALLIISLSIISILYFNRYLRSWKIFNKFIEFSRFHFFLYL
ncbi:MAG: DUF4271 domain-containing protein, partial [Bacteroidota bacterium]